MLKPAGIAGFFYLSTDTKQFFWKANFAGIQEKYVL